MSATDHGVEAIRLAALADQTYGQLETRNGEQSVAEQIEAQTLAATAQVHATLALAEQQRIANLIAYSSHRLIQRDITGSKLDYPDVLVKLLARADGEIRHGLGVSS